MASHLSRVVGECLASEIHPMFKHRLYLFSQEGVETIRSGPEEISYHLHGILILFEDPSMRSFVVSL